MNMNNLPRTVIAICAFAAGIAVSFFTLPLWVAILQLATREGSRSDWLGFAGGLMGNALTGMIAGLAIFYGWKGIERQMRIGIIGREEERIEKVVPGVRETIGYLQDLHLKLRTGNPHSVVAVLHSFNDYNPNTDRLDDCLKKLIPAADAATRQRLLLVIETILFHAEHADADQRRLLSIVNGPQHRREMETNIIGEARSQAKVAQTGLTLKMMAVQAAVKNLKQLESELLQTSRNSNPDCRGSAARSRDISATDPITASPAPAYIYGAAAPHDGSASRSETGAAFFPVQGGPQATRIATDKTDDSDAHAAQCPWRPASTPRPQPRIDARITRRSIQGVEWNQWQLVTLSPSPRRQR